MFGLGSALLVAVAGCGAEPADPAVLPADQMVFRLSVGSNGFSSRLATAASGPDLVVYGDGRVVQPTGGQHVSGQPTAYDVARADPVAVARFVADAERRGVVGGTKDFGDPPVTDQPFTSVLLHGPGGRMTATVYASDDRFDDGLPRTQRRARGELREIIAAAFALPGDAARTPIDPDRVRVIELDATDGDRAGSRWPGPEPARFLRPSGRPGQLACGTLSGTGAWEVYVAALDNPDGRWSVDGRTRVLLVSIILPGMPGCS